jgi:hypothetical protein
MACAAPARAPLPLRTTCRKGPGLSGGPRGRSTTSSASAANQTTADAPSPASPDWGARTSVDRWGRRGTEDPQHLPARLAPRRATSRSTTFNLHMAREAAPTAAFTRTNEAPLTTSSRHRTRPPPAPRGRTRVRESTLAADRDRRANGACRLTTVERGSVRARDRALPTYSVLLNGVSSQAGANRRTRRHRDRRGCAAALPPHFRPRFQRRRGSVAGARSASCALGRRRRREGGVLARRPSALTSCAGPRARPPPTACWTGPR